MIDTLLAFREKADASMVLSRLGLRNGLEKNGAELAAAPYALLTLHRPSNVDERSRFVNILEGIKELSHEWPIIFPVHPRTRTRIREFGLEHYFAEPERERTPQTEVRENATTGVVLVEPLGYLDFLCLMKHARVALTDSGGIQEETTCLGVPCVTIRENTERPVTVECGTNIIAGVTQQGIRVAIRQQLAKQAPNSAPENWDGAAGPRIVSALLREVLSKKVASDNGKEICASAVDELNSSAAS
jgi:UDP-N-acetylglucosamine 2-epimerase (non-hydrolysing)